MTPPPVVTSNSAGVELAFTLVCVLVVAGAFVVAAAHWRRGGGPIGVLLLLGGMAATVQEPMVDVLGNMFIPPSHYTLFTAYGREMPIYAPFGYGLYFGIFMFVLVIAARSSANLTTYHKLLAAAFVLELGFELTAVNGGFYTYYGGQPLRLFELPAHWMTLNMAASWVAAAVVVRALPYLTGWRICAVPAVVVSAITGSYYAQGWPIFTVLHAEGAPEWLRVLASVATVVLGLTIMQAAARVLAAPPSGPARRSHPTSSDISSPEKETHYV